MPGFVKTPKDEARWHKAKQAAKKSKNKEESEFSDRDWALVNHIYHSMSKSHSVEDISKDMLFAVKIGDAALVDSLLAKAKHMSSIGQGDDLEKARPKTYDEDYLPDEDQPEEYEPEIIEEEDLNKPQLDENEEPEEREQDVDPRSFDVSQMFDEPSDEYEEGFEPETAVGRQKPSKAHREDMTPEQLEAVRLFTGPLEAHNNRLRNVNAEAHVNPEKFRRGRQIAAVHDAMRDHKGAIEQLRSSEEYRKSTRGQQARLEAEFNKKWKEENPEHQQKVVSAMAEAREHAARAKELHGANKQLQSQHILRGATAGSGIMSSEAAAQHVGGVRGDDEGPTVAGVMQDPAAPFARMHSKILQGLEGRLRGASPSMNEDEFQQAKESLAGEIRQIQLDAPKILKDPVVKKIYDNFVGKYYPLITQSERKILNNPDYSMHREHVGQGDLVEPGLHALINAVNTYNPEHHSKAKFPTYAQGLITNAMKNHLTEEYRRAVPLELREQAKAQTKAGKMPSPQVPAPSTERKQFVEQAAPKATTTVAPEKPAMRDPFKHAAMNPERTQRMHGVNAAKSVIRRTPQATAAAAPVKQPKIHHDISSEIESEMSGYSGFGGNNE